AGVADQVVPIDVVLVTAYTGDQRQAIGELGAVLGEQREGAGGGQGLWAQRRSAVEPARCRLPGVDVVAAHVFVRRVVVDVETDPVVLGRHDGLAGQA